MVLIKLKYQHRFRTAFLLSVLVFVSPSISFAQQTCPPFSTNTTQIAYDQNNCSGSQIDNTACKEIHLLPGYHFDAQPNKSMHTYINPYQLCDVDYVTPTSGGNPPILNTGLEVGTTPGSFAVSPSGGATYNIPLLVPLGTMGMSPNLSITYNSQGGNGLMGMGWDLSGLSAITRTTENIYNDGNVSPVSLSMGGDGDRFLLDGKRLIMTNSTTSTDYGLNGITYGTEAETFINVTSYGDPNAGGGGPVYFKVETKDGKTLEYGNTPDSYIEASGSNRVLTWLLNKVKDSRGNFIKIHYYENNSTGEFRPDYIEYTGNDDSNPVLSPYNQVKFIYGTRTDKQLSYVRGSQIRQNVLLVGVQMFSNNVLTHEYNFNYAYDFYSRLVEVDEKGTDGKQYNPIIIDWQKYNLDNTFNPTQFGYTIGGQIVNGDFNGDGFSDIVSIQSGNWYLYLNNGNNQFVYISSGSMPAGYNQPIVYLWFGITNSTTGADFNGDGKTDIVVSLGISEYVVLESTGSGFAVSSTYDFDTYVSAFAGTPDASWLGKKEVIGDFDGDGKTDLFVYYYDLDYYWYYSSLRGPSIPTAHQTDMGDASIKLSAIDYDGDGKMEVMIRTTDFSTNTDVCELEGLDYNGFMTPKLIDGYPDKNHDLYMGDFNGDGKTDILTHSAAGGWNIGLCQQTIPFGSAHYMGTQWISNCNLIVGSFIAAPGGNDEIFVADFNGDGKADIVDKNVQNGVGTTFKVLFSDGNNFIQKQYITSSDFNVQNTSYIGDYNGDGINDIAYQDGSGNMFFINFNDSKLLVNRIFDGLGKQLNISYNTLPELFEYNRYTKDITPATFPVIDFQQPMTVVSEVGLDNGVGGMNSFEYSYGGAKLHLQGKGFLGFLGTTSLDVIADKRIENTYSLNTFFQPTLTESKTLVTHSLIDDKTFTYFLDPLGFERYYTYVNNVVDNDVLHGNVTSFTYSQNQYGNPFTEIINNSAVTSTTTYFFEQKGAWIPSRLTRISTTTTRSSPSYTRTTNFTNNNFGQPLTKTDPDLNLVTTYQYDDYGANLGNLSSVAVSGPDITGGTTNYSYDGQGRFVTSETNALGHTTTMTYDDAYGNILSKTDPNLLLTKYRYDGFGRLEQTTTPTNQQINVSRALDNNSSGIQNSVYFVETTEQGAPAIRAYYDVLSRSLRTQATSFSGGNVNIDKTYFNNGLLEKESEPYTSSPIYTYYFYDIFHRLNIMNSASGATTTNFYSGNSVQTQTAVSNNVIKTVTKTLDASGLLASVTNDVNTTNNYTYHSCGKPVTITTPGGSAVTMTYDNLGRALTLNDPDAGITTYQYDALGEITYQQNAKQAVTNDSYSMTYDALGRLQTKTGSDGSAIGYLYDTKPHGKGMLSTVTGSIIGFNGISCDYNYDNFSRLQNKIEQNIDGNYTTSYQYDNLGHITKETYPDGFAVNKTYNNIGYLDKIIKASDNTLIWQCKAMTERGQVSLAAYGNNLLNTTKTYDGLGYLQNISIAHGSSSPIWEQGYSFDPTTGNLISRSNNLNFLIYPSESFMYDQLDRLTQITLNTNSPLNTTYYSSGNILSKDDVGGIYDYSGGKPHAVSAIDPPGSVIPTIMQTVTYTAFNKVNTIVEGTNKVEFKYGPDYARKKMLIEDPSSSAVIATKYYLGDYEKTVLANNDKRELHYISGSDGLCAIFAKNTISATETDTMYYINTDHLGSISFISNDKDQTTQEISYDAWGRRRDPSTWTAPTVSVHYLFDRGFTGHEHLDQFNLINMNGRLYDPLIGRMLSPDNNVQFPENTQAYNRYSYVFNNPLKFIDPSGNDGEDWSNYQYSSYSGNYNYSYSNNNYSYNYNMDYSSYSYSYNSMSSNGIFDMYSSTSGGGYSATQSISAGYDGNWYNSTSSYSSQYSYTTPTSYKINNDFLKKTEAIAAGIIGSVDYGFEMLELNSENISLIASTGFKGAATTASFLNIAYEGYEIRNQYREGGGFRNVNPFDAASATAGATGLIASGLSAFGYGGTAALAVSEFTGPAGLGIGEAKLMYGFYKSMNDMSLYGNVYGIGIHNGDPGGVLELQREWENGFHNESDYWMH